MRSTSYDRTQGSRWTPLAGITGIAGIAAIWLLALAAQTAPALAAGRVFGKDCNADCAEDKPGWDSQATRAQACQQFVLPAGEAGGAGCVKWPPPGLSARYGQCQATKDACMMYCTAWSAQCTLTGHKEAAEETHVQRPGDRPAAAPAPDAPAATPASGPGAPAPAATPAEPEATASDEAETPAADEQGEAAGDQPADETAAEPDATADEDQTTAAEEPADADATDQPADENEPPAADPSPPPPSA